MSIPLERDPKTDHLLTPENSALVLIDYQPGLIEGTHSISRDNLVNNVVAAAKTAAMYEIPTVISTIAVSSGYQKPTIPEAGRPRYRQRLGVGRVPLRHRGHRS